MKPHLKLDQLDIVEDAKSIWYQIDHSTENNQDINFFRQVSKTMGHYSLGKVTKRWDYFRKHFEELTNEPCVIEFYVGNKENYRSSPHTDRGRTVAINIPIKVDLENSTAFFGKYDELSKYPAPVNHGYEFNIGTKHTDFKSETNQRYQGDYVEGLYEHVDLDWPVLFNPAVPHGGWNKSDDKRILMSLSFDSFSYEQAYNKCIDLGWTSAIS